MNIYNRIFDNQSNIRIRFEAMAIDIIFKIIDQKQYNLCWSFMLEYENDRNPFRNRRTYIKLLSASCSTIITPDEKILNIAEKVTASSNTKLKDAVHLACAIYKKCDYFITCDDQLIRTIDRNKGLLKDILDNIVLFNPIDFVRKELNVNVIE
jgi:predicted nucleic acid-binding protein